MPSCAFEDPYVLGVLIALAQHQQRLGARDRKAEGHNLVGGGLESKLGMNTADEESSNCTPCAGLPRMPGSVDLLSPKIDAQLNQLAPSYKVRHKVFYSRLPVT